MASIQTVRTKGGETRYRVRYRVNGRTVEEWRRTAREARALKLEKENDAAQGNTLDPRRGAITLDAYFATWLRDRLVKGRPLSPATKVGYRRLYDRNITGRIGTTRLRALRPDAIRTWHADTTGAAGPNQAAKSYRLLRAVLATAEADELIRSNPCKIRGGGEEHAAERPMVPTSLVLELSEAVDDCYRPLVLLAGFAGLRTGESLGLIRADVDLLRREVRVERQAQEVAGYGRILVPPKTEAGRRTVALPRLVVEALEHHLAEYVGAGPDASLFTSPGGSDLRRATVSEVWRAAVKATGAPEALRPHDLRHHAATLTARKPGITTKELMARIGHASPRAALIYQHATAERDREVADFLDDVIAATDRPKRAEVVDLDASRGADVGLAESTHRRGDIGRVS